VDFHKIPGTGRAWAGEELTTLDLVHPLLTSSVVGGMHSTDSPLV